MNTKIILTIATISMITGCSLTSKFKNYDDLSKNERNLHYKEKNISKENISLIESNIENKETLNKTEVVKITPIKKNKKIEINSLKTNKDIVAKVKPKSNESLKVTDNLVVKAQSDKEIVKSKSPSVERKTVNKKPKNEFKVTNRIDIKSVFEIVDLKKEIMSPHLILLSKSIFDSGQNMYSFHKFKYLDKTTTKISLTNHEITIKRFIEKDKEFFEFRILKENGNNQYLIKKVYELSMLKNSILEVDKDLYLSIKTKS
jgi:hypothetical protein